MDPIVLIHGYSAEGTSTKPAAIRQIYGDLPAALAQAYGGKSVVEVNLSRYVSLEDGVTVDDISFALERALRADFAHLLSGRFNVVIHSTGALVIRNWIRRFSARPSPIRNLIHLAGANFGSGWAHVGKGQMAKWGRLVFEHGSERGLQVLDALGLGADWTLDLHLHLARAETSIADVYQVFEYVICGTQADAKWFMAPIRYAKEDGSDGVVRVSGSNLSFNYLRLVPTKEALDLNWKTADKQHDKHFSRRGAREAYYRIDRKLSFRAGQGGRPEVPLAVPYRCAHSGDELGIVSGSACREQVLRLVRLALETTTAAQWAGRAAEFAQETAATYEQARSEQAGSRLLRLWPGFEPRAQYDPHAQLIFRLRDQDGRPVRHFDVFLDSLSKSPGELPARALFEHTHANDKAGNILTFYLRTEAFDKTTGNWEPRVPKVNGCFLEIVATERETGEIAYVPLRYEFSKQQLAEWIRGHRTTIVDVELLRLPSPRIYTLARY